MKTSVITSVKEQDRKWYVIDAEGKVLGRLATRIADILRGKNKATFTPHVDMGDHVVVINADKIAVTGRKEESKYYYQHSGHPGNLRLTTMKQLLQKKPTKVLSEAVYGMLPKNKLRDHFMSKLHLYVGAEHQHAAQNPQPLEIKR